MPVVRIRLHSVIFEERWRPIKVIAFTLPTCVVGDNLVCPVLLLVILVPRVLSPVKGLELAA